MIVTSLLVRWGGGWHDVTSPSAVARHGRIEAALGLGASSSLAEVETVANQQLAIFGDPRTEIPVDLFPRTDDDRPLVAFSTADRVTVPDRTGAPVLERVQAITATMDGDGRVTYAVDLRDVLLDEQERFAETLAKMANGTLGGDSKVAQPTSQVPVVDRPDCCPAQPPPGDCA